MVFPFKRPRKAEPEDAVEVVILTREGNQIAATVGTEGESDLRGLGDTAACALRDLAERMEVEKFPLPAIDF
jgi:hypothetical protein